jgi:hypothetical protein
VEFDILCHSLATSEMNYVMKLTYSLRRRMLGLCQASREKLCLRGLYSRIISEVQDIGDHARMLIVLHACTLKAGCCRGTDRQMFVVQAG